MLLVIPVSALAPTVAQRASNDCPVVSSCCCFSCWSRPVLHWLAPFVDRAAARLHASTHYDVEASCLVHPPPLAH